MMKSIYIIVLIGIILVSMNQSVQANVEVPPKPTLIEPVSWPPTVYLPIVFR